MNSVEDYFSEDVVIPMSNRLLAAESLLIECAKQFRLYEANHRAKNAYEKAETNKAMAEKIERFIREGL